MKIGQYIHELLKENETVIIPGFGAFISQYKPAETVENEIQPPTREILFTQQIRNNDGLLVGYVAEHEKLSHFDALKWIEKERENIIFQLDKGEKVRFENMGELYIDEQNLIKLNPFRNDDLLLDSYGLEPVSLTDWEEIEPVTETPESAAEPVPEASESTAPEPVSEEQGEPEPEPVVESTESESTIVAGNTGEDSPEEAVEPEKVPEVQDEATPPEQEQEKAVPVTETKEPEPVNEPVPVPAGEEEKKRRSGWWFLLILIPVAIASVFLFNKKKEQETTASGRSEMHIQEIPPVQPENIPVDTLQAETDSIQMAAVPVADSTKIQPKKQDTLLPSGPKFYLIGGGFKEKENAETYMQELLAKGENAFYLGKRGNFHMVAVGTYKTEAEAVRAKRKYSDENPGTGAWILEENN